jgi:hypothetical protein
MRASASAKSWGATTTASTAAAGADNAGDDATGAATAPVGRAASSATGPLSAAIAPTAASNRRPRRAVDASGRGLPGCRAMRGTMVDLPTMLGSVPANVKRAISFAMPSLSGTVPAPSFS